MRREKKEIFVLRQGEIAEATTRNYRQYFCGNLQRPQELDFISTPGLEIGMSDYREFQSDMPHLHKETEDMIFVLEGEYHVKIISTDETIKLSKGDFISVPANTAYASKAAAGTKTLFIKQLNGADKVDVNVDEKMKLWLKTKI